MWTQLPEVKRVNCHRVFDKHDRSRMTIAAIPANSIRRKSSFLGAGLGGSLKRSSLPQNLLGATKATARRASFRPDVAGAALNSDHTPIKHVRTPSVCSPAGESPVIYESSECGEEDGNQQQQQQQQQQRTDPSGVSTDEQSGNNRKNSAKIEALNTMPRILGSYSSVKELPIINKVASHAYAPHRKTSCGRLLELKMLEHMNGAGSNNSSRKSSTSDTNEITNQSILAKKIFQANAIALDASKYEVFLPQIILRDICCGGNRFTKQILSQMPSCSRFDAAVLFVDISGFTNLTERLNSVGTLTHGAENLCNHVNAIYTKMITELKKWGGDCVKFSGDALLVMFEVYEEDRLREIDSSDRSDVSSDDDSCYLNFSGMPLSMADACKRAVNCSRILHDIIAAHPDVDGIKLGLHIGVGCGICSAHVIGGVLGRWEFILSGDPVDQIGLAGPAAGPLETVVSPQVWKHVKEEFIGEHLEHPNKGFVKVTKARSDNLAALLLPKEETSLALLPRHISWMHFFLPHAVVVNMKAGVCDSSSQAEMREVTTMFVSLPNLNLADNNECQSAIVAIQEATYRMEGSLNKVVVDDKGAAVLIVFGMPPVVHSDDPKRALAAAFLMRHHLHDLGLQCQIGLASGRVFCGIVGAESRKEYTVMGDGVNLAARLMSKAEEYEILCCESTYEQSLDKVSQQFRCCTLH